MRKKHISNFTEKKIKTSYSINTKLSVGAMYGA
jgi:hypothetical protein